VRHRTPILSTPKAFDDQGVIDFDREVKKSTGEVSPFDYVVEPKISGAIIVLLYEGGVLESASTVGDGYVGEDVTANLKTILAVPLDLTQPKSGHPVPPSLEVRGAVYMEKELFDAWSRSSREENLRSFSNPRDAAMDSVRQVDLRVTAKRPLDMFICGVGDVRDIPFDNYYDLMVFIQELGFRVNRPFLKKCAHIEEVIRYCHRLEEMSPDFAFETEGAVIRVNQLALQRRFGGKQGGTDWALTYMFQSI